MASTFVIHARRDWTFQLVLLGSHCSAWVEPTQTPHDVADRLMRQPSCCL